MDQIREAIWGGIQIAWIIISGALEAFPILWVAVIGFIVWIGYQIIRNLS